MNYMKRRKQYLLIGGGGVVLRNRRLERRLNAFSRLLYTPPIPEL